MVSRTSSSRPRRRLAILGLLIVALVGATYWVMVRAPVAEPARLTRVGYLALRPPDGQQRARMYQSFLQGLADHGYEPDRNIQIVERSSDGDPTRLAEVARELIALPADVIVAADPEAASAAHQVTSSVPIVMAIHSDPVRAGLVQSLGRPGGNVTGLSFMRVQLVGKRLELLREIKPDIQRVAVLWHAGPAGVRNQWQEAQASAAVLDVTLISRPVTSPTEIDDAFATAASEEAEALLVLTDALTLIHRDRILQHASALGLPNAHGARDMVEGGGLLSYAPDRYALYRRAAYYVHRILTGLRPADLPVEQPVRFEFVINGHAARQLGVTFPESILVFATEAIW